jgi:hypothetical protein
LGCRHPERRRRAVRLTTLRLVASGSMRDGCRPALHESRCVLVDGSQLLHSPCRSCAARQMLEVPIPRNLCGTHQRKGLP